MNTYRPNFTLFFESIASGSIEIYNEISLQHELGIFLRDEANIGQKIQFERPVDFFGLSSKNFIKKEIDISIFTATRLPQVALELKFPRNGQYPEQIFKACQDIMFLEQATEAGFESGFFVIVVDDKNFYRLETDSGDIYGFFRGGRELHGIIQKPTGKRNEFLTIRGHYQINWKSVSGSMKYAIVEVNK